MIRVVVAQQPKYSIKIIDIDYPSEVETGQTFTIRVTVRYSFSISTGTFIHVYEHGGPLLDDTTDTLSGDGTKTYSFKITAPSEAKTWQLNIHAFYWKDGEAIQDDMKSIYIRVKQPNVGILDVHVVDEKGMTIKTARIYLDGEEKGDTKDGRMTLYVTPWHHVVRAVRYPLEEEEEFEIEAGEIKEITIILRERPSPTPKPTHQGAGKFLLLTAPIGAIATASIFIKRKKKMLEMEEELLRKLLSS